MSLMSHQSASPEHQAKPVAADAPELSVIVPTYREAQNLPVLVPRVFDALREAQVSGEMVIVDDDSGDDTESVVAELAQRFDVRLIVRTDERGLSSAVLRGFEAARGAVMLVMDADLSHPPERVPAVAEPLRANRADFAIGSRYVAGGRTQDWGQDRKLNSLLATWLSRPLTTARDPMAGFFCLRRETWRQAAPLNPIGYKIGLELIVKCGCRRVEEVPIIFTDRLHGESKLTNKQRTEYLRQLVGLYRFRFPWLIPAVIGVGLLLAYVLLARPSLIR
ncbi:MAG: polyprenol monophosphomannose synthase [Phycisphaerae bacterium]